MIVNGEELVEQVSHLKKKISVENLNLLRVFWLLSLKIYVSVLRALLYLITADDIRNVLFVLCYTFDICYLVAANAEDKDAKHQKANN